MEENNDYVYIVVEHRHSCDIKESGKNILHTSTNLLAVGNNSHWAEGFTSRYVQKLNLKKAKWESSWLFTGRGHDNTEITIKVIRAPMEECENINIVAEEISFSTREAMGDDKWRLYPVAR